MVAAITKIKEAEDAGAALMAKATEAAAQTAREAAAQVRERARQAREAARAERAAVMEQAKADAEAACAPLDEAAAAQLARIAQPSDKDIAEAVARVVRQLAS